MSRHYSNGRLVALECDHCGVLIAPNPGIADSGWMKCGMRDQSGTQFEWDYCPDHAYIAQRFENRTSP